jgi:hypothetical protein
MADQKMGFHAQPVADIIGADGQESGSRRTLVK